MTAPADTPTLAVTQEDREAAAAVAHSFNRHILESGMRTGVQDHHAIVQAFARHRTNTAPRPAGELREALAAAFRIVDGIAGEINGIPNEPTGDAADIVAGDLAEALGVPFDADWPEAAAAALATHSPAPMAGEVEELLLSVNGLVHWAACSAKLWRPKGHETAQCHASLECAVRDVREKIAALAAHPSTQEGGK